MSETPEQHRQQVVGRAAQVNPPNRFEAIRLEDDLEHLAEEEGPLGPRKIATQFYADQTRRIICENDSPDIPFRYSINPYRGCEHGCAYCYARPGHEYLGMNAGLDFETKILVKRDAAALLRRELARPHWRGEELAFSGVTDCYQPVERRLRITRSLLEVMADCRQAVGVITKNALVTRDLDLLGPLAASRLANVSISMTSLDENLARQLEPRTAAPAARLRAIERLSAAGVPVRVMVAPVIPALNDCEIPAILRAAKAARASSAGYILLRLPLAVAPVFLAWLEANRPLEKDRIVARIRDTRGGRMSDARWGSRLRGEGDYAGSIGETFRKFARATGLGDPLPPLDVSQFRRPETGGQLRLF